MFIAPQELRFGWDWRPRGERCDGTLARPYARGGYVALGWPPPSRQGTEVPRRGVADARVTRPFARAKRGPRNGVSPAAPRSPTRKGLAPRSALNMGGGCGQPPVPSVGDLSNGGGRPGRARPTATSPQAISTLHLALAQQQQREKKGDFFRLFSPLRLPDGPGSRRPGVLRWRADGQSAGALIAQ